MVFSKNAFYVLLWCDSIFYCGVDGVSDYFFRSETCTKQLYPKCKMFHIENLFEK